MSDLEQPKKDLLRRLSLKIHAIFECTQLAIMLGVDDDLIIEWREETRDPNEIAFRVLKEWLNAKDASGANLYKALNQKPFEHLARQFKAELLSAGGMKLQVASSSGKDLNDGASTPEEAWRQQDITSTHILALESTTAPLKWVRIGRRLHKENKPGRPDAFNEADFERFRKKNPDDDRECFRIMINSWKDMSMRHTVGFLYDALVEEDLEGVAERVFLKAT